MKYLSFITLTISMMIAVVACLAIVLLAGEGLAPVWAALERTWFNSFGLGYTLFYTTPLIFTGLSVAVAFHCGLFNIGAEGQLYLGSLAVVIAAYYFPGTSSYLTLPLSLLAILIVAGSYGAIVGALKAYRGSHEVIVTILLNFIAYALVDYAILYPFKNPESPNPESFVLPDAFHLSPLSRLTGNSGYFDTTPSSTALFVALAVAILVYFLLYRSTLGFELRAVGKNMRTAQFAGISVHRHLVLSFAISGALAGLVGVNEVLGNQHRLIQGFSPQYGFTGIAVAMLARNHPLGIIASAFLFGSFHNFARELEFESNKISKELSFVLQGVLIAMVASEALIRDRLIRWQSRRKASHV